MTLFDYIDKYGNITFDIERFNEVDNIIFASLSYIDFNNIVSRYRNKISIHDAAIKFLNSENGLDEIEANRSAKEVLKKIYNTSRYKDLLLSNYYYIGDVNQQFSAVAIEINEDLIYLSYEGTDSLVSGWEEDFKMSYMFPVKSQRNAINYINKYIFTKKKIIVGGHSKGGNLALVAAMYASRFVKKKIVAIYSNDGPGLRSKEYNSKEYKYASLKLHSIIPNYSFIGLVLKHSLKYKVVKSSKKGIFAHDFITWEIDDKYFKKAELSEFSKILDKSMNKWINKYSNPEREKVVISLFDVFRRADIKKISEINNNK